MMPGSSNSRTSRSPSPTPSFSSSKESEENIHKRKDMKESSEKDQEPETCKEKSAQEKEEKEKSLLHKPSIVNITSEENPPTIRGHIGPNPPTSLQRAAYKQFGLTTSTDEEEDGISNESGSPTFGPMQTTRPSKKAKITLEKRETPTTSLHRAAYKQFGLINSTDEAEEDVNSDESGTPTSASLQTTRPFKKSKSSEEESNVLKKGDDEHD